ncbi:MAG: SdpI family protein [Bacteroidia bacterium]|nr:SdpI family protein [Bacteroidia bacterium]
MKFTDVAKKNGLTLVLALFPLVLLAIFWEKLPEEVPVHWNIKGEVDDYGSPHTLIFLPLLTLLIVGILWAVPFIDPKKKGEYFLSTLDTLGLAISLFMLYMFSLILIASLGYKTDISTFVIYGVLFLLMFLGNYFGKLRPNYFVGIRTPWTLEREDVWIKTHRFSGIIWVGGSLLMMILKLFVSNEIFIWFFIPFIVLISLGPVLYSYLIYKK